MNRAPGRANDCSAGFAECFGRFLRVHNRRGAPAVGAPEACPDTHSLRCCAARWTLKPDRRTYLASARPSGAFLEPRLPRPRSTRAFDNSAPEARYDRRQNREATHRRFGPAKVRSARAPSSPRPSYQTAGLATSMLRYARRASADKSRAGRLHSGPVPWDRHAAQVFRIFCGADADCYGPDPAAADRESPAC